MTSKSSNKLLSKAKKAKKDEFYTQRSDIERELQYYHPHFKDKVVYCNCDDPRVSNFFKFFLDNFKELGLKKLISSGFRDQNNEHGCFYESLGDDKTINVGYFNSDGDFRSKESIELLKQSDIIVTNPPFSLFREYVAQIIKYEKHFLIIGNINAITYKEIFTLIQNNQLWLGINMGRGIKGFIVPTHYDLYGTEAMIDSMGNRIVSPNNCLWLTNLETEHRYENINLIETYAGNENKYLRYDNYDGINVNKTKEIPMDYEGYMGVPITFLHKFNPDQFELVKFRKGDDEKDLSINGKYPYFRILIKRK